MPENIRIAILTISDTVASKQKDDESGPELSRLILASSKFRGVIAAEETVEDDQEKISKILIDLTSIADVILTSGGTGFSARDVTPEAAKAVIEKECPGLSFALLQRSLEITPLAALSRLCAGIRQSTLIVTLPGSPKAVKECFEVLEPLMQHAVEVIHNELSAVSKTHALPFQS